MSTDQQDIVQAILGSKPIAYRADFAKISGSVTAGVMLSQAYYWHDKSTKHDDGWFEKTGAEWHDETGLTDKQQQTARFILAQKGFMDSERKGDRGRMCSRVNHPNVYAALVRLYGSDRQNGDSGQIGKKDKLNRQNGQSKIGKKANLSYNRIHTKNTTEITEAAAACLPRTNYGKETKTKVKKAIDLSPIEPVLEILREENKHADKSISINLRNLIRNEIEAHGAEYVCSAVRGRIAQAKATCKPLYLTTFFDPDRAEWRATCAEIGERKQNAPQGLESGFKSTLPDFSHIKYDDAPIDEAAWQTLTGSKN